MTNSSTVAKDTFTEAEWSVLRILAYHHPSQTTEAALLQEAARRGHSRDALAKAVTYLCEESKAIERVSPKVLSGEGYSYRLLDPAAVNAADQQWSIELADKFILTTANEMFLRCVAVGGNNSKQVGEQLEAAGLTRGEVAAAFNYCVTVKELVNERGHGMMSKTPSSLTLTADGVKLLDSIIFMVKPHSS